MWSLGIILEKMKSLNHFNQMKLARKRRLLCWSLLLSFALASGCQFFSQDVQENTTVDISQDELLTESLPPALDSLSFALFNGAMAYAEENELHSESLGNIMVQVGEWFMAKPYAAGTLDGPGPEQLVIKLDGFDCVTFVESTLALSRTISDESYSLERFASVMREQRYRGSELDGYCSRLHYFSEWIYDNELRGNVENLTKSLGGIRRNTTLNFMSSHRESYPKLAQSDSLFQRLIEIERTLEDLELYYIPQDEIRDAYDDLLSGDIIALATDIEGLDVVHTGLVYRFEDGRVGLMHASTVNGVTVSSDLQEYVENNRRQIGIVVARPVP